LFFPALPDRAAGAAERRASRLQAGLLALFLAALAVPFLGSRGLWEPDEGRYSAVALQMVRTGDWLHPALQHEEPHYTKPPLTYWAMAAGVRLLGESEWALRLPNALAFLATGLLIWGLGRRLVPGDPALPAVVWGTSLLPYAAAHILTTDTLLALWETLAVAGFVAAWCGGSAARRRGRVVMWAGFGLAFLTKGPPGLLPLGAILGFVLLAEGRRGARRLVSGAGLAVFAILAFGWYLAVVATRPDLLHYLLRDEVVDRIATAGHDRNPQWYGAFEVYIPALVLGSLPWTWVWVLDLVRAVRRALDRFSWRRPGVRQAPRETLRQALRRAVRQRPETAFLLLWLLLPLGVFALARSRLPLYMLPLMAPLALLVARSLGPRFDLRRRRVQGLLGAWGLLLIALAAAAAYLPHDRDSRAMAAALGTQMGEPFREVVFVDVRAWSGLALYTGVEVERVAADTDPRLPETYKPLETLCAELADPHETGVRAFVVPEHHGASFEGAAQRCGAVWRRHGGWRSFRFYAVETKAPGTGSEAELASARLPFR
jgi:4-amino-4-deoxy-L-arabinose transferase